MRNIISNRQLIIELKSIADPEYKAYIKKITPGLKNPLGVRVPDLRLIAEKIVKGDWRRFLDCGPSPIYEVQMVRGFVCDYAPMYADERIQRLEEFLPEVDNWAVCDTIYGSVRRVIYRLPKTDLPYAQKWIERLATDKRTYAKRAAAVMILSGFNLAQYIDWDLKVLLTIDTTEEYYAQMGVAWALATLAHVDEEKVMVAINQLKDPITRRFALQKIRTSKNISSGKWKAKKK